MNMGFVVELKWRGLCNDLTPGTEDLLNSKGITGYIGFDPSADSLHIGNLVQIMLLVHFQRFGHNPIALIGGATGMVGDPSGKSEERNLLSEEQIRHNSECIKAQLQHFLDFENSQNKARMVNNIDWFDKMRFLEFIRDVGKHITVNYMLAKESVRKRIETGISFTEFSYQLVQGFDFYWLYKNFNCKIQMGGSDQWGNIVTGTELIRRKLGEEAFGLTSPLITKSDGSKFGKTAEGNIWLDSKRTSPYKMYQFWLNISDEDALNYIRTFTLISQEDILDLEKEHSQNPHLRILQKRLAKEVTTLVHSLEDCKSAITASNILFGKSTREDLISLTESDFLSVFEGVPQRYLSKTEIEQGIDVVDLISSKTDFVSSKSEALRSLKENSISINKTKVSLETVVTKSDLIDNKYILLQRGKKFFFLLNFE